MEKAAQSDLNVNATKGEIAYFSMSLWRLALLSFFTFGIYDLYWFYKNWQAVQRARPEKIYPFWRALFAVFYVWPLCNEVFTSAKQRGFKPRYPSGVVAFAYVACFFGSSLLMNALDVNEYNPWLSSGIVAIELLSVPPLLLIQQAINGSSAPISQKTPRAKASVSEKLVIGAGVLFGLLLLIGLFAPPDAPPPSPERQAQITKQQGIVDSLTAQYNKCSADLWDKKPKVDTANQAAVDSFNADWDACEAIRLQQNKAVDAYNTLTK